MTIAMTVASADVSAARVDSVVDQKAKPMREGAVDAIVVEVVADLLRIPPAAVRDALTVSIKDLEARGNYDEISGSLQAMEHPRYPLGSACIKTPMPDARDANLFFLMNVSARYVTCVEDVGDIKRHATFAAYVQMLRDGLDPPYSTFFEAADYPGKGADDRYLTVNRRRCLAAQEVGTHLTGWLNPENRHTDFPLKIGDVVRAYEYAANGHVERYAEWCAGTEEQSGAVELDDVAFESDLAADRPRT